MAFPPFGSFFSLPFPGIDPADPPWKLLTDLPILLEAALRGKAIEVDLPEGVTIVKREFVAIGKGTVVEPGVMIEGPCVIGEGCTIRHGAYIRPFSWIGDECTVGHASEVKGSVLMRGAQATHFTYVGDSVLGMGVNLGAGVKCANLRLDRREVKVAGVGTGLRKLGAIVGDGVQVGCNVVISPGSLIGPFTVCHPLVVLKGIIPPKSEVRGVVGIDVVPLRGFLALDALRHG